MKGSSKSFYSPLCVLTEVSFYFLPFLENNGMETASMVRFLNLKVTEHYMKF